MSSALPLLPLFPLSTVLLPGGSLPLHVFEPRYRLLVQHLIELPPDTPRHFGVVAIRSGREVGVGIPETYAVGCAARLADISAYSDGRFDIGTTGTRRFRLHDIDAASRPYLLGSVEWLDDPAGDSAATLTRSVTSALQRFAAALEETGHATVSLPELPEDPIALSWAVGAVLPLTSRERQIVLEAADAARRLLLLRRILRRELALLRRMASVPAADLMRVPLSMN